MVWGRSSLPENEARVGLRGQGSHMATAVLLAGSMVGAGNQEAVTLEAQPGLLWNQREQMLESGLEADLLPRREPCQQPVPPPCSPAGPSEAGRSELQCLEGELCLPLLRACTR